MKMRTLLLALAASSAALCAPAFAQTAAAIGMSNDQPIAPYFPSTYLVAQTGPGVSSETIARPQRLTPRLLDEAARSQSPAYVVYSSPRTGNLSLDDAFFGR